jgi:WD40 repeat protein
MAFGNREKKPSNCLSQSWRANLSDHVVDAAWSADGSQLIAGAVDGKVCVYDSRTGDLQRELTAHAPGLAAIAIHPKEPALATCGHDGKVRLWSLANAEELAVWEGGSAWVERIAWNAEGTILASAAGKKVRLWDFATRLMIREFADLPSTVADIAWQPWKDILTVAVYGGVSLYSPEKEKPVTLWPWKGSPLKLAWSPSGAMLAHGNQDASVHFRYADTGAELHMSGYPTKVRELSWDFRGRYLATAGGPGACIWDCFGAGPEGTTPRILEGHAGNLAAVTWQRKGFLLASGDVTGRLCVWQTANRSPLVGGAGFSDTEISCLAWSPDDKALAVGTGAGALAVFKVN